MPVTIPNHVQEFMQGKPGWVATAGGKDRAADLIRQRG